MTVILRPRGRGRWHPVTMTLTGKRAESLFVQREQRIVIGGITWRIVEVRP